MRRAICRELRRGTRAGFGGTLTTPTPTPPTPVIEPLECRRLFAAATTYTLIELTFEPTDLNNLDQIAAADNVYQIRKGGRLEAIALPTLVSNGRIVANRINDNGTLI